MGTILWIYENSLLKGYKYWIHFHNFIIENIGYIMFRTFSNIFVLYLGWKSTKRHMLVPYCYNEHITSFPYFIENIQKYLR